jgi:hypothetical protein
MLNVIKLNVMAAITFAYCKFNNYRQYVHVYMRCGNGTSLSNSKLLHSVIYTYNMFLTLAPGANVKIL